MSKIFAWFYSRCISLFCPHPKISLIQRLEQNWKRFFTCCKSSFILAIGFLLLWFYMKTEYSNNFFFGKLQGFLLSLGFQDTLWNSSCKWEHVGKAKKYYKVNISGRICWLFAGISLQDRANIKNGLSYQMM